MSCRALAAACRPAHRRRYHRHRCRRHRPAWDQHPAASSPATRLWSGMKAEGSGHVPTAVLTGWTLAGCDFRGRHDHLGRDLDHGCLSMGDGTCQYGWIHGSLYESWVGGRCDTKGESREAALRMTNLPVHTVRPSWKNRRRNGDTIEQKENDAVASYCRWWM